MKTRTLGLVSILALGLGGCATLNESQCRSGDWPQIGYRDGAAGARRAIIDEHDKACAEYKVRPDANAWYAGYERGLVVYCTPERGFEEGLRNARYGGVCPLDREPAFLARYGVGQQLWKARADLEAIDRDIRSVESQAWQLDRNSPKRAELMSRASAMRASRIAASANLMAVEVWARATMAAPLVLPGPPPR